MTKVAVRFLNQDLVRIHRDQPIHQQGYANAMVAYDEVDWDSRITIYKNKNSGILDVTIFPQRDEKFISFPIASDSHYFQKSILKEINKVARDNGLSQIVCTELFPRMSIQNLVAYGIPLSSLSERIVKVFGSGETAQSSKVFKVDASTADLRNVTYQKISLGQLVRGKSYQLGENLPKQVPTLYVATVDSSNNLLKVKLKGDKELDNLEGYQKELDALVKVRDIETEKLNEATKVYNHANDQYMGYYLNLESEKEAIKHKTLIAMSIRYQNKFTDENKADDVLEHVRAKIEKEHARTLEEMTRLQNVVIDTQIEIDELETVLENITSEMDAISSKIDASHQFLQNLHNKH